MGWLLKGKFKLFQEQKGIGLIETLIGLALLGIISVAFLSGLTTTSMALMANQESVIAESLAKSQLEHIKSQEYISVLKYDPGDPTKRYKVIDIPPDLVGKYDIEISVAPDPVKPAGRAGFELQSITVVIKLISGKAVLSMSSYRVGLAL